MYLRYVLIASHPQPNGEIITENWKLNIGRITVPVPVDKAIPLQTWTGPEGSRSLRLPDFKTVGT
jgi:hypothetical protein